MVVKKVDEKKIVGASYIYNFSIEVNTLTHNFASYTNAILQLQGKYGEEHAAKASDTEKTNMNEIIQNVRHNAIKCYILYKSIIVGLKKEETDEIKEAYEKVKNKYVLERKDLEEYALALNTFLMSEVIGKLLESSTELIESIFGDSKEGAADGDTGSTGK